MSERFYCDRPIAAGEEAVLAGTEAHHLLHVMRLGVGGRVTLFDGEGAEFTAEVSTTSRRDVTLAVLERHEVDRESAVKVVMGVALPKGDRQKVLIEKLTELGVAQLVPLVTERSGASSKKGAKGNGLEKLRRGVIEASKQCGRNRLMEIAEPTPLADFLGEQTDVAERLIAHPGSSPISLSPGTPVTDSPATSVAIAIGPEGGFSEAEYATALAQGWEGVGLGERILRIETAAIALAALRARS